VTFGNARQSVLDTRYQCFYCAALIAMAIATNISSALVSIISHKFASNSNFFVCVIYAYNSSWISTECCFLVHYIFNLWWFFYKHLLVALFSTTSLAKRRSLHFVFKTLIVLENVMHKCYGIFRLNILSYNVY